MELALGVGLSLLTEAYKFLVGKFGKKATDLAVYSFLFVVVIVYEALVQTNVISMEAIQSLLTIVSSAVLTYELILKKLKLAFQ